MPATRVLGAGPARIQVQPGSTARVIGAGGAIDCLTNRRVRTPRVCRGWDNTLPDAIPAAKPVHLLNMAGAFKEIPNAGRGTPACPYCGPSKASLRNSAGCFRVLDEDALSLLTVYDVVC